MTCNRDVHGIGVVHLLMGRWLAQVILTTKEGATLSGNTLPVSYPKFMSMVQKGDTIFLGRYLVTGSEESSCYLTVSSRNSLHRQPQQQVLVPECPCILMQAGKTAHAHVVPACLSVSAQQC